MLDYMYFVFCNSCLHICFQETYTVICINHFFFESTVSLLISQKQRFIDLFPSCNHICIIILFFVHFCVKLIILFQFAYGSTLKYNMVILFLQQESICYHCLSIHRKYLLLGRIISDIRK